MKKITDNLFVCINCSFMINMVSLKVLWTFKNIFETPHDLNDSDEKTKILKTPFQNSNRVKSYASLKIMQITI